MRLTDLKDRTPPTAWEGETKIPWHEPGFSARMLREHLSQRHDRASRRFETIDQHAAWIHEHVLGSAPSRVLDLGCGPGFYTSRLARLGHECIGVDFSPASIAYAEAEEEKARAEAGAGIGIAGDGETGKTASYYLGDVRTVDPGAEFDVVLMVFGEYDTFSPDDAVDVLASARRALRPGGALVIEVHDEAYVQDLGGGSPTWFTAGESLFSDEPHLCLREVFWDEEHRTTIERYYVAQLADGDVRCYTSSLRALSRAEHEAELVRAGFGKIEHHASLAGTAMDSDEGLFVLVARADG